MSTQALAIYQKHGAAIELVVLDFTMPGMTGLEVLRELLKIDPGVQVILSSGHVLDNDADQLLAAGARAFLAKPYRPEELVAKIRQVLDDRECLLDEFCVDAGYSLGEQACLPATK
jgi:CheY-like chemotaxis protein